MINLRNEYSQKREMEYDWDIWDKINDIVLTNENIGFFRCKSHL